MESLHLPKDLFWSGKMEPFSPEHQLFSLNCIEEDWTIDDSSCLKLEKPLENLDSPLILDDEITEQLFKEFEKIKPDEDTLSSKSESSEQWTDTFQGVDVASLMHLQSDNASTNSYYYNHGGYVENNGMEKYYQQEPQQQQSHQPVELTQITPPQTPPMVHIKDDYIIQNLISQHEEIQQIPQIPQLQINEFNSFPISALSPVHSEVSEPSPVPVVAEDIARETQIVDDILRTCAQELPDNWNDDDDNTSSFIDDDSSWSAPSPVSEHSSIGSPVSSVSSTGKITNKNGEKKRVRPYGRGLEERKSRKKEQNKNAATRYRQKKKEEMKTVIGEESILAEKHEELTKTVTEYEKEIKYLKKLIREFYKKK